VLASRLNGLLHPHRFFLPSILIHWVRGAVGLSGQWMLIGLLQIDAYSARKCIFIIFSSFG
jgi:hypothetical protein